MAEYYSTVWYVHLYPFIHFWSDPAEINQVPNQQILWAFSDFFNWPASFAASGTLLSLASLSLHDSGFLPSLCPFTRHTLISSHQVWPQHAPSLCSGSLVLSQSPNSICLPAISQFDFQVPFLHRDEPWAASGSSTGCSNSASPKQNRRHPPWINPSSASSSPLSYQ